MYSVYLTLKTLELHSHMCSKTQIKSLAVLYNRLILSTDMFVSRKRQHVLLIDSFFEVLLNSGSEVNDGLFGFLYVYARGSDVCL